MRKRIKALSALLLTLAMTAQPSLPGEVPQEIFAGWEAATPKVAIKSKTLYVGGSSYQITVKNLAEDAKVTYLSSDKKIVTVTDKGVIKPIAKGSAAVTVKISQGEKNYNSEISVTVKEPYVKITNPVDELAVSDSYCFLGKTYGLKNTSMRWSVSNTSLATINEKTGVLVALGAGKVKITLRDMASKKSKSIELTIVETSDKSDEERAQKVVVKDDQTGYLMYQGVCYEVLGKESVGVVDYYDLEISSLTIPDTILYGGWVYPVTEVYDDVFSYSYDLKTLAIGNNVRVLGENAFSGCTALTKVTFGTGLEEIKESAFEDCDSLEEISIPEGVTSLGAEVFSGCTALSNITLPETLTTLGDNMFFDCTSLQKVKIPDAVETIPYGMFTNCTSLAGVELGKGVLVIEAEAFWACESLTEITLPKGLVYLGERAFYSCALHSITFPDRKVSVGENVFDFCEELSVIRTTKAMADYYEAVFGGWYEYDVEGGR